MNLNAIREIIVRQIWLHLVVRAMGLKDSEASAERERVRNFPGPATSAH